MSGKCFDVEIPSVKADVHIYERFKRKIFEYLPYRDIEAAISLSRLFSYIEKTVKVLGQDNVYQRCLVVFKALIDCAETPNSFESEYLKIHLSDDLTFATAESLCRAVSGVRQLVGMKYFHEQVINFWKEALLNPEVLVDPPQAFLLKKNAAPVPDEYRKITHLSSNADRIVNEASKALGIPISVTGQRPADTLEFEPERISWKNSALEKLDFPDDDDEADEAGYSGEYDAPVELDAETLFAMLEGYDQPRVLMQRLENVLISSHSADFIQQDLVDLLGVDNFELLSKILENRKKLAEEIPVFLIRLTKKDRAAASGITETLENSRTAGAVVIKTKKQVQLEKQMRKEEKRSEKEFKKIVLTMGNEDKMALELARAEQQKRRQAELQEARLFDARFMSTYGAKSRKLPFVYDAYSNASMKDVEIFGVKYALPEGTTRKITSRYQEVIVPPQERNQVLDVHPVMISSLDPIGQAAFQGFEKLNTIQSIVFEQAYNTPENLLICAPTGAGKTNVALLTILKTIRENVDDQGRILKDKFKIVYIAPMKALATEMTRNFTKRLSKLGLKVRELTGDTQLTRKEISETQMLVLTPEKWDVVTRKADDDVLTNLVRLLIIDEVHILHDERGPVIETIVARTLRHMEAFQQYVRIVGLSATVPNYLDVATFLNVNHEKGLFFFDGRFRPVPLTQTFVGVNEPNNGDFKKNMDETCYDKCMDYLRDDHQVLIFVHSRNSTAQLANFFVERSGLEGDRALFLPSMVNTEEYRKAHTRMKAARSKDVSFFFTYGLGIHHAGLNRTDRLLMEQMFSEGHIKVLCCTSTLAWGVNLPAHAVIIRGTDVFDPNRGVSTDLGILDVQQIFGRAGRPQFETSGHGIILTPINKLDKYIGMLIRQTPIESKFQSKINDNLNAEISRGTVLNLREAVEWLRFTYFYVRARINPIVYGIDYRELRESPNLQDYLEDLAYHAASKLKSNDMVEFDSTLVSPYSSSWYFRNGTMSSTPIGRIASTYYITFETIEIFSNGNAGVKMEPFMTDDKIIALICASSEFSQIQARDQEMTELDRLAVTGCALPFRGGGLAYSQGKVNCLLQCYISRIEPALGSLSSETYYISQNASRVARALFEITLHKGWAYTAMQCLQMAKFINRRLWNYNSPLRQLVDADLLDGMVCRRVEAKRTLDFFTLLGYDAKTLEETFHTNGNSLHQAIRWIPSLECESSMKQINETTIRVDSRIYPAFVWKDKLLGQDASERFHYIVEDCNENRILYHESFVLNRKKVTMKQVQTINTAIHVEEQQLLHKFQVLIASDSWVVDNTNFQLSLFDGIE